jgi:hypothetical protein
MSYPLVPCDWCPARVIWGNTGKALMAVNPDPVPGGNVVLIPKALGAPQIIVTNDPNAHPGLLRYTSHFDGCPGAEQARKPKVKPPPQKETLF